LFAEQQMMRKGIRDARVTVKGIGIGRLVWLIYLTSFLQRYVLFVCKCQKKISNSSSSITYKCGYCKTRNFDGP